MKWKPTTIQILGIICVAEIIFTQSAPETAILFVFYGIYKIIFT